MKLAISLFGLLLGFQVSAASLPAGLRLIETSPSLARELASRYPGEVRVLTDSVVLVPEQAVEVLQRPWTEYCARRVLTVTGIGMLEVQRGDADHRKFKLDGTRWICEGKEGERAEVGDFANERLRDLTAKRVLDARGEKFAHPAWTLAIKRQDGDRLAGLDVFEPASDGPLVVRVTGRDDMPAIAFELGALDSQSLRQLWQ